MSNFSLNKWKDFRLALLAEQALDEAKAKAKKQKELSDKPDKDKATHIKVSKGKGNPNIKVYKEGDVEEAKPTPSEDLRYEEIVKIGEYTFSIGKDMDGDVRVSFKSTNNFPASVIEELCSELVTREEDEKEKTKLANKAKKKD